MADTTDANRANEATRKGRPADATRPTRVSVAIALSWVAGVLDITAGIVFLLVTSDDALLELLYVGSSGALATGVGLLLVGAITLAVGAMLSSGANGARGFVSALMGARIIVHAWAFVALQLIAATESVAGIVIALAVLGALWSPKANTFFSS